VEEGPEASADREREEKVKREEPRIGEGAAGFFRSEEKQVETRCGADERDEEGDALYAGNL